MFSLGPPGPRPWQTPTDVTAGRTDMVAEEGEPVRDTSSRPPVGLCGGPLVLPPCRGLVSPVPAVGDVLCGSHSRRTVGAGVFTQRDLVPGSQKT